MQDRVRRWRRDVGEQPVCELPTGFRRRCATHGGLPDKPWPAATASGNGDARAAVDLGTELSRGYWLLTSCCLRRRGADDTACSLLVGASCPPGAGWASPCASTRTLLSGHGRSGS